MENFFNWMSKPVPKDEVLIWFNVHNMNYEKIELYGDVFKSLNHTILETYLGSEDSETRISISEDDNNLHFEWCWDKVLENFSKENIIIKHGGQHKDYLDILTELYKLLEKNIELEKA